MSSHSPETNTIDVRPYRPDDWEAVKLVILSALQQWGFLPSHQDHEELGALKNHTPLFTAFFVAEDPHVFGVIGCAGLIHRDETTCELRKIYLLNKFQGKGIGKNLLLQCIEYAKTHGYQRMRFEVHPDMIRHSYRFYEQSHFHQEPEETPRFHPDNHVYYLSL